MAPDEELLEEIAADIESQFGLPDGAIDRDQRVSLVFPEPTFASGEQVILFHAASPKELAEKLGGIRSRPRARRYGDERLYVMARGSQFLVSRRRRPLLAFLRTERSSSLAARMDEVQAEMARNCDVLLHIPLNQWRPRIRPFVALLTNVLRLQVQYGPGGGANDEMMQFARWVTESSQTLLDQMSSVSFGLRCDGRTLRLAHHHAFSREGSISEFLSRIRHGEKDQLDRLPDRPFVLATSSHWRREGGDSVSCRLLQRTLELPSVAQRMPAPTRERLLQTSSEWYDDLRASYFMMTTPRDCDQEWQLGMLGGYIVPDSRVGLQRLLYIQGRAREAVASLLPGCGPFAGKAEVRTIGHVEVHEFQMHDAADSSQVSQQIGLIYGHDCRLRMAAAGPRELVFAVSESPDALEALLDERKNGPTSLIGNPAVAALRKQMSRSSDIVVLVDLGQCLDAIPNLTFRKSMSPRSHAPAASDKPAPKTGPLLGWTGRFEKHGFTGELAIAESDFAALGEQLLSTLDNMRSETRRRFQDGDN